MTPRVQPGDVFNGRYRIDGELGSGGFATVYRATNMVSGEEVALKILSPGPDGYDVATRGRFQRELEVLASLRSPYSVSLRGHGETPDGVLYAAFEVVEGEDLSTLISRRGRLTPQDAIHVLTQLLEALAEAHRAGILHRDLKPGNVRVYAADGDSLRVKLLDFGIARPTDDGSPAITATGELIGTPRFMSPEQLMSRPLGPASDIYSLGILTIEMLLGRDALQGNRWGDQLERMQSGYVFPLPGMEREGADLMKVLVRMTARSAADRFQAADAVLQALRSLDDDDQPTPEKPAQLVPGKPLPAQNRRILLGVVGLVLVLAVAAWAAGRHEPTPTPPAARRVSNPLAVAAVESPAKAPTAQLPVAAAPRDGGADSGCGHAPPMLIPGQIGPDLPGYAPHDYDPQYAHPVVILLHDDAVAPDVWLKTSGFMPLADEHRFLVIALRDDSPYGEAWRNEQHGVRAARRALDDIAFDYCVDRTRVFVVGQGHGGDVVNLLVCEEWVTAAATNSHPSHGARCNRPKPFLLLFPTATETMPVEGGADYAGAERMSMSETEAERAALNSCAQPAKPPPRKSDTCVTWACETPFKSCLVEGGRGWPGDATRLKGLYDGPPPRNFRTATVVWDFFASVPLPKP